MSKRIGKAIEASRVKQLILGTNKHYPIASQQLKIGGVTYTVTALSALLQSFVDLRQAVDDATAARSANSQPKPPKRRPYAQSSPRSWRSCGRVSAIRPMRSPTSASRPTRHERR